MVKLTKIQASTLVEAIVAMVIISITFAVTFGVLNGINLNLAPQLKLKAFTIAQRAISNDRELKDKVWDESGVRVEKNISRVTGSDIMLIVEVKVYSNTEKLLINMKKITADQP